MESLRGSTVFGEWARHPGYPCKMTARSVRFRHSPPHKGECKEPSTLPFKQFLAGASPVAFSKVHPVIGGFGRKYEGSPATGVARPLFLNVNAKRLEHFGSQPKPIEFDSRHVHQYASVAERYTHRVENAAPSGLWVQFPSLAPSMRS
jgi:hypothetical protein